MTCSHCWRPLAAKDAGGSCAAARMEDREEDLLQVRHRGEVELEGGDERGAAPLRSIAGERNDGIRIAGQDVALDLRQVGVVVAQIQGEYLPGEGETDVPGRVVGQV